MYGERRGGTGRLNSGQWEERRKRKGECYTVGGGDEGDGIIMYSKRRGGRGRLNYVR